MRLGRRAILLLDIALLLLVWFAAAQSLDKNYLPGPGKVVETFVLELQDGLLRHALVSTWRVLVSVMIGSAAAAPLAVAAAESRTLDRFLSPLVYFLYPVPKIVFLPIIVLILGLGNPSIIFLIALVVFFQIYVIVRDAAAAVPLETVDSVNALGASRWQRLRYVYIPVSLPAVVTALKVSVGTAVAVLFIAETIGNNVGLGYYIVVEQWNRFAYAKVYAGILALSLLGSALFLGLSLLERRLNRWQRR